MVSTNCLLRTISSSCVFQTFVRCSVCPATRQCVARDGWSGQARCFSYVVSKQKQFPLTNVTDTSTCSNHINGVSLTAIPSFSVDFTKTAQFCASGATTLPLGPWGHRTHSRLQQISKHFSVIRTTRQYHSLLTQIHGCIQPSSFAVVSVKWKSSKSKQPSDCDEESDEELDDDDYDAPLNFKKNSIVVSSMRVDSVVSSALDVSRKRVDELFYASKLRVNGERLLKKSRQLDEGDYVDLITERASDMDDHVLVKRVKVLNVSDERTAKDKLRIKVKVWKTPFPVLASPEQA